MQQITKKTRRCEISLLNAVFCLLVIFIHIISYAVSAFAPQTLKYNLAMFPWRSASFVVQGFIMLSGIKLFLTKKDDMPYGKYLKSRFISIIIPYTISFFVYYVFYFFVYDYPLDIRFISTQFFTGSLVCHLYFIPIIVQFDLLLPVFKKVINKCSFVFVIPFCVLLSQIFENHLPSMISALSPNLQFVYNDRIFTTYLAFYVIGCYIGKYYDEFLTLIKSNFKTIFTCFFISFILFVLYTFLAFNNIAYVPFMNSVHFVYVLCVLIFLYALSVKYAPIITNKISIIKKIDSVSFNIYLYHMLVLFFANYVVEKFGILSQITAFFIRVLIVYCVTIYLCNLFDKFIKRNK